MQQCVSACRPSLPSFHPLHTERSIHMACTDTATCSVHTLAWQQDFSTLRQQNSAASVPVIISHPCCNPSNPCCSPCHPTHPCCHSYRHRCCSPCHPTQPCCHCYRHRCCSPCLTSRMRCTQPPAPPTPAVTSHSNPPHECAACSR
jgi:hypothetical protein